MVRPGTCLPKARTIGRVIEWSPPRQTGRKPLSSNSPTFFSMAANGSSKVNFKSPASQSVPSAPRSTPVSVHEFAEMELAGHAPETIEGIAFQPAPLWPGTGGARVMRVPQHLLRYPRYHVEIRFRRPVLGPVLAGIGRHYGIGLFAAVE